MLIPLAELIKKHKFNPKGVLHVGASTGQEAQAYYDTGIKYTFWIEPIPEIFEKLDKHLDQFNFKSTRLCNILISDVDNQIVDFHIANNEGQSSSMLTFGTHTQMHPTVKFTKTIKLETARLDTIFTDLENQRVKNTIDGEGDENPFYPDNYDFLNVDVQGAELKVLKSLGTYISYFKWLYLEVNEKELYKGCPLMHELDTFLVGYKRVETKMTNFGWGDAFYIRKDLLK